jgi:NAD(P)-dependent dehydrogenase (short-subunit alcohol dehydrogenase family)
MKEVKNKVAVITGAASGIGYAIAQKCVREGMRVALADIDEENLAKAEDGLKGLGGIVLCMKTNVANRSDIELLAQKTLDAFGGVHLLVNNAGVGGGGSPWEATWNDWEWVINVNLWGVIHGVKVFTPIMLDQGTEGHIVNTASIAGLVAGSPSMAPYAVSKHAVVALSESLYFGLRLRNARINVSVLCPAFVNTRIMDSDRNRPATLQNEPVAIPPHVQGFIDFMNASVEAGMPPEQVAEKVFEAIKEEKFYILTHPEWTEVIKLRVDNLLQSQNPQDSSEIVTKVMGMSRP